MEPAQKHFQAVLEMEAPEELRGLPGRGYGRLRPESSRPRGRGRTAVFNLLNALRLFRRKSLQEDQDITF